MPRRKKGARLENFKASSPMSINIKEKPQQRNAANARERARMRVLSRAFCRLKTTLPWVPADTKLSKLDTLRLASSYIAHLKGILRDDPFTKEEQVHPAINLTWPFGFNRGGGTGSGGGGSGSDDESSDCWEEVKTASNPSTCTHLDSSSSSKYSSCLSMEPNEDGQTVAYSSSKVHSFHRQHYCTNDNSNLLLPANHFTFS